MMARRVESVVYIRAGCPARLAAAMLRRAFLVPILAAPPVRATQPWSLSPTCVKTFSQEPNIEMLTGQNLSQNQTKIFHLNRVPRQDHSNALVRHAIVYYSFCWLCLWSCIVA